MKWRRTKSDDVIDVRGAGPARGRSGGLPIPGGLGAAGGGLGLVGLLVFLALTFLGGSGGGGGFDIGGILGQLSAQAPGAANPQPIPRSQDPQADLKDFSVYVFKNTQDTWAASFRRGGEPYDDAQLVLYSGAVDTGGCGHASSAVGPFYCPGDNRVYLDLTFYQQMQQQLGAGGDFAWAYVIAHEMGHHVQNELGINDRVARLESQNPDDHNELSVRTELQADCYAGVWASTVYAQGDLESGDLEEAFHASEAVGDDRLQRQAGVTVDPDSFTHGSSEQRHRWFEAGYEAGDPAACDTFSATDL
jgi:predicted metalloprotease